MQNRMSLPSTWDIFVKMTDNNDQDMKLARAVVWTGLQWFELPLQVCMTRNATMMTDEDEWWPWVSSDSKPLCLG